ncbi:MAG: VanZ family protein [Burkholderiales bacterium]|jgi:VanZ family protein|nr:VanZ family protein [Burkholderiales bacterium]
MKRGPTRLVLHGQMVDKPWQRRASPLARTALLAYVVLTIYAGLAPWEGWRDVGVPPLAYLAAPIPRWLTPFDLTVNVLGYLPVGVLAVLALHPRVRGAAAVLAGALGGLLLAGGIEALQTYLPTRVASNVDVMTNAAGALIGALLAAPLAPALIDRGRLQQLRARWFLRDASVLLVLLALFPFAQVSTTPMLFGNGRVLHDAGWLAAFGGLPEGDLLALFGPAEFVLAEALVVVAAMLAAGLALAALAQPFAPRRRLLLAFVALALGTKAFAYAWLFGPAKALLWLTPGAVGGLAIGLLALLVAAHSRPRALLAGALLAALVWLVAVNLVPENPYAGDLIAAYRRGRLRNFTAIAEWLTMAWPWLLLGALLLLGLGRKRVPPP